MLGAVQDWQSFKVSIDDGLAVVAMDRPPVNAIDRTFREELVSIFDELSDRDDIRCVVLTGAGRRSPRARTSTNGQAWSSSRVTTRATTA